MPHRPRYTSALVLGLLGATAFLGGCDLQEVFDDLDNPRTLVNVSVTHHATAEGGTFPDRGGDGEARTFETDEGWTITLVSGFVTTASITLHGCDGDDIALDMYWGPLAEDITGHDLAMSTVGGVSVAAAEFCGLGVEYGPYPADGPMDGLDARVAGATFYFTGAATRGDTVVPFEIRSSASLRTELDMSTIAAGAPLRVDGGEDFPVELALSKTYDRLFDTVDFETVSPEDLAEGVGAVLTLESRVGLDRVAL